MYSYGNKTGNPPISNLKSIDFAFPNQKTDKNWIAYFIFLFLAELSHNSTPKAFRTNERTNESASKRSKHECSFRHDWLHIVSWKRSFGHDTFACVQKCPLATQRRRLFQFLCLDSYIAEISFVTLYFRFLLASKSRFPQNGDPNARALMPSAPQK